MKMIFEVTEGGSDSRRTDGRINFNSISDQGQLYRILGLIRHLNIQIWRSCFLELLLQSPSLRMLAMRNCSKVPPTQHHSSHQEREAPSIAGPTKQKEPLVDKGTLS